MYITPLRWSAVLQRKQNSQQCGKVAQLVRACGSYPQCREFKSPPCYHNAYTPVSQGSPGFFAAERQSCRQSGKPCPQQSRTTRARTVRASRAVTRIISRTGPRVGASPGRANLAQNRVKGRPTPGKGTITRPMTKPVTSPVRAVAGTGKVSTARAGARGAKISEAGSKGTMGNMAHGNPVRSTAFPAMTTATTGMKPQASREPGAGTRAKQTSMPVLPKPVPTSVSRARGIFPAAQRAMVANGTDLPAKDTTGLPVARGTAAMIVRIAKGLTSAVTAMKAARTCSPVPASANVSRQDQGNAGKALEIAGKGAALARKPVRDGTLEA